MIAGDPRKRPDLASAALPIALVAIAAWSNWPIVRSMADRWTHDARYSHGLLVPAFSAFLLWRRRGLCPAPSARPSPWGIALIAVASAMQVAGALVFFGWLQGASLIATLAGVVTLWGGPRALRWAAPALGFLVFAIPLPYRVEVALGGPLQRLGTVASTYALQTLGLPAIAEGSIIRLDEKASIAVVEACNGLGMLAAFACYATAAAILLDGRDRLTRAIILLSAAPLAIVANLVRITATGLVHSAVGGGMADFVFHDLAGWLMMPLALLLLGGELSLLGALIVEKAPTPRPPIARRRSAPAGRAG